MCGNKRRAARHQGECGRRNHREAAAGGIASIIGAIQEIELDSHGFDPRAPTGYRTVPAAHTAELDAQLRGIERGVIHDYPTAKDEKTHLQQETIDFEELPSYEASTGARSEASTNSRSREPQYTPATSEASFNHTTEPQPHRPSHLPRSNTETLLLSSLDTFRTSLLSYSQGVRGAKKDAKHAAKCFVRDLRAQEIAKIRSERGYLEHGERKQVKMELKPVKDMLKGAVREAKQERKGRY